MKKIISFILFCFCALGIQAQSFVFEKDGVELPNNTTLEVSEITDFPVLTIESGLDLSNKTSHVVNIIVSQTVIQAPVAPDAYLSLCFVECLSTNENVTISGELQTRKNDSFHVFFAPQEGVHETVVVKYEVVNANDPSDKITATLTYRYGASALKPAPAEDLFKIYQKGNQVVLATHSIANESLQATVYDVAGQTVAAQLLPGVGEVSLEAALPKGMYILVISDKQTVVGARKFIIH